jgi:hypothetical protein
MTHSSKKKSPKKGTREYDAHQRELENKKWNENIEKELITGLEKTLLKDPNGENEEQAEARTLLHEHHNSNDDSNKAHGPKGKQEPTYPRRKRLCERACGHFIEVIVPAKGPICCNCEECQTNGWCMLRLIFALVEHGTRPTMENRDVDGVSIDTVQQGWTKNLKCTVFNESEEEEELAKTMHNTYLPKLDPLFSYVFKICSVPVPWTTKDLANPNLNAQNCTMRIHRTTEKEASMGSDGQFRTKVVVKSVDKGSRAIVLVGDIIVAVNGRAVASDDGSLLPETNFKDVISAIKDSPTYAIPTMDVLRKYSSGRTARIGTFSNYNDTTTTPSSSINSIVGSGAQLSAPESGGLETTGLGNDG